MFCKILKKEFIKSKAEDVYDISVENFHNFVLANGAIVHNCDSFQSAQIKQQLAADGFNVDTISVDRLDSQTKQCLPYAYLKSTIYEKRLTVFRKCDLLTEEVIGLERESDGHIQHPEGGTQGSKDSIDSICASVYNASLHAEEFAYDYGESLTTMLDSNISTEDTIREQINIDFEEELKKSINFNNIQRPAMSLTIGEPTLNNNNEFSDNYYMSQGIIVI